MSALRIELLPATMGSDLSITKRITDMVNEAYRWSEDGQWVEGATRTNREQIAELIRARQIAAAWHNGTVVGSVRVQPLGNGIGEIGMLASDPNHSALGIGLALGRFAEQECRDRRLRTLQIELLVPRDWRQPAKDKLGKIYSWRGYQVVRTGRIEEFHPELAPQLATPCDSVILHKDLRGELSA
jgi:hypothetical protein